ncbi:MAG: hypothetical protein FWH21_04210, partial [Kiritimatiellaeota bacterium]|nr:hypothetical protein [Kiritimatiellota bacterium]
MSKQKKQKMDSAGEPPSLFDDVAMLRATANGSPTVLEGDDAEGGVPPPPPPGQGGVGPLGGLINDNFFHFRSSTTFNP